MTSCPAIWSGTPNEARIDVNRLLPDGRPNPKYLKIYADVGQSRNYSEDSRARDQGHRQLSLLQANNSSITSSCSRSMPATG